MSLQYVFGDKYKQWNAAFEAGYAAALGKSIIVMHGADHQHALKEVDAAALAVVETSQQVVEILEYIDKGTLPAQLAKVFTGLFILPTLMQNTQSFKIRFNSFQS